MSWIPCRGRASLAALSLASLLSLSAACDLQRSRDPDASVEEAPPPSEVVAEPAAEPAPEVTPTPALPVAEPETTEVARPEAVAAGPGPLDGLWIGGPPAGFEVLLEIDGTLVTATDLTGGLEPESTLFEQVDADGPHARFRAAGAGAIVQVHALFLSPDEALVWLLDEGAFAVLRRVGSLPEELLGDWQAVETSGARAVRRVSLENDQLLVDGELRERLYPLEASADTVDLVAVSPVSGAVRVLHYRRLDSDVFLSWAEGGDTFAVFYRTGARPEWLPGERGAETAPPTPTPTPPTSMSAPPTSAPTGEQRLRTLSEVAWTQGADVRTDLTNLARAAVAHWTRGQELGHEGFPASTEWTPPNDECPMRQTGTPLLGFDQPTWRALGFSPSAEIQHQYRFVSETVVTFEVQARIDSDCDGVYHKLSISGLAGDDMVIGPVIEDNPGE